MKKSTLTEELNRMKNLMTYKTDSYRHELNEEISSYIKEEMSSLLKEAPNDEVKEVSLQANFNSGKWKDKSMPKQEILDELREAVDWLRTKSDLIKQSGGIIDGKAKILTIQIEAGESQVTNYDTEVDPKTQVDVGVLSERRAKTIQNFLTTYFKKLQKDGTIDAIPIFEPPKIVIGPTPWNPDAGDKSTDEKFKKEQFIKVNLKLSPPSACLEGLTIEVMYVKEPNSKFPCRGGHQCDDAQFDVELNKIKLDGVANLNNAKDGGSRSSKFIVTPQQALSILGNKPGNIMISFVCKYTDKRCHSSTPEVRLSKGNTVIYHACTPSITETNDYRRIDVMELDACGNLIKKGEEKKAAQKDEQKMTPPAGLQKGWLVYDIATKLPVFKPSSAASDLKENIYKKYLPLYGYGTFDSSTETELYKGKCNEPKIYGGWCLWTGYKMNYVNNSFCGGGESGSYYRFGLESTKFPNAGTNATKSMRSYLIDNCDSTNIQTEEGDIIRFKKGELPKTFNLRRLYAPYGVVSNPSIIGSTSSTPFKLVPNEKPNGVNFTPKLFIDFVNNLGGGIEQNMKSVNTLISLMNVGNIKGLTTNTNEISFDLYITDDTLVSPIFTNSAKIDSYISKYNTFKDEKLTGWVNVGSYTEKVGVFSSIGVGRVYEKGSFKSNKLRINVPDTFVDTAIIDKLISLKLVGKTSKDKVIALKS